MHNNSYYPCRETEVSLLLCEVFLCCFVYVDASSLMIRFTKSGIILNVKGFQRNLP